MKPFLKLIFFTLSILVLSNCARTGRPEGGPKDEEAPLFVTANPPYETINFDKDEVRIYFNEFIKLKDLNKQLVVSPPLKNPLIVSPQGTASKFLKLEILDTLKKNTTYIFNFGNAVEDNNENNVLEGFKYVFSTGTYIDSLKTIGSIKDAVLKETPKSVNILLYKIDSSYTDSIVFKKKPNYITNTLDTTRFELTNLREGKYLMIALKESSSDYLFDPKLDKIGFYKDTIVLPRDSIIEKSITLFKEIQEYKFRRAKEETKGKIIFGYEGAVKDFNVKVLSKVPEDFKSISKFEKDKDTLNYWYTPIEVDSLNFEVSNANFRDTVTVRLRKKKIDSLILNSSIKGTLHFRDTFFLEANNPIIDVDTSKISLFDKDTIPKIFKTIIDKKENKIALIFDKKPEQNYSLTFLPEALSDIFEHKNDTLKYSLRTKEIEDYGRITLNAVNPESENIIIELLEGKDQNLVERRFISKEEVLVFDLLEPKTYTIRAIIDTNNNKKWDTGNFLSRTPPEKIIYYSEEMKLRANYFLNPTFNIKKE
ncbi:MAG: Ig-like domain-containing protein [Polaribacter sp.]